MSTPTKKKETPEASKGKQKSILEYFSQTAMINSQNPVEESDAQKETPKKQKSSKRYIIHSSSETESSIQRCADQSNNSDNLDQSNKLDKSEKPELEVGNEIREYEFIQTHDNQIENISNRTTSDKNKTIGDKFEVNTLETKNLDGIKYACKTQDITISPSSINVSRKTSNSVLSKIIAEYMEKDLSELASDFPELSSELPAQEERYEFLINVKDQNMIRRGEPGYDRTTLHIPKKYYERFTPFEKQFWDIKKKHFDTVIFFKKGKFYELYEDDAAIASKLFDLRVTDRVNMKMAGVPESSFESWAAKFIKHGYKIGRVEQAENAIGKKIREQNGKKDKIIGRELKEIVTCGTAYTNECIDGCFPFFLGVLISHSRCSLQECAGPMHFSVMLYDASINKIFVNSFCDTYDCPQLKTIFVQNDIRELITDEKIQLGKDVKIHVPDKTLIASSKKYAFSIEEEYICFVYLHNFMKHLFREKTLESATIANIKEDSNFMSLDGSTLVNLDILSNNFDYTEEHSLFKAVNYCSTAFGQRLLRKWITSPLKNLEMINERRRIAKIFTENQTHELIRSLEVIGDIERCYGRLGGINPSFKDLKLSVASLKRVCIALKEVGEIFKCACPQQLQITTKHMENVQNALDKFEHEYRISETDVFPGSENDELFALSQKHSKIEAKLSDFLQQLKISTGFCDLSYKSLGKEVFQIETSINNKMPAGFYLVSSTKTQRRYYSQELKELVSELEECEELIFQSKGTILRRAVDSLKTSSFDIHHAVNYLASMDCIISFSLFNTSIPTTTPEFGSSLELLDFTNPIYPAYIRNSYIPKNTITLVTGPNMGGKSTFLRSICLNIILAQTGMNVACRAMELPIFDRIFTRIGASDSLAKGESTFMVEMNEASKILNRSTNQSFVIMDELGRGTSTRDGEAIAHAVLNYLKKTGCRCLFSTHYHKLVQDYEGVDKAHVECKVEHQDITFLYKVKEGICGDSHGLYVAKMAGIPDQIVEKARKIRKKISTASTK